jgi:hypothetical protein
MEWIHLPQDRDQRRYLVKTVINFGVSKYSGNFLRSSVTGGF